MSTCEECDGDGFTFDNEVAESCPKSRSSGLLEEIKDEIRDDD
jgi:hypothetical protein